MPVVDRGLWLGRLGIEQVSEFVECSLDDGTIEFSLVDEVIIGLSLADGGTRENSIQRRSLEAKRPEFLFRDIEPGGALRIRQLPQPFAGLKSMVHAMIHKIRDHLYNIRPVV